MSIEQKQRRNRLRLADMLENRIRDDQFDMRDFTNDCGTAGCALGIAALSGEFGYGWHPGNGLDFSLPKPIKNGVFSYWDDFGTEVFGTYAMMNVFIAGQPRSRQIVAAELRAIK